MGGDTVVKLQFQTGKVVDMSITPATTGADVMTFIHDSEGIPPAMIILMLDHHRLRNEDVLMEHGIEHGSVVRVTLNLRGD